jgi:hypothetical protein
MGTLCQLVDGWTKQPWDGENYLRIVNGLYGQLSKRGEEGSYLGRAVISLKKTILENNETIEMGLDTDETARGSLRRILGREKFTNGAKVIEVEIETTPELKVTIPNLDSLVT